MEKKEIKKIKYYIQGMRCASCEILLEKRLLEEKNIKAVEANANHNVVFISHEDNKPSLKKLNKIFNDKGYFFSEEPLKNNKKIKKKDFFSIISISLLIIIVFIFINKTGFASLISVNSKTSLPVFFIFGLLAGFSSCAALVGGIILSMSKQWTNLYAEKDSVQKKMQPHIMFNIGRIASYTILGALLGVIGQALQISLTFTSIVTIAVAIMMFILGLQMIGIRSLEKFQLRAPKFITKYIANESNFKGRYLPLIMGALTFFLPCGFTITAQGLALTSGSLWQGALIMLFFALGTLPALFLIGLSSVKMFQKSHMSGKFLKVAGVLVLFFALFNFNAQLNTLGLPSLSDISFNSTKSSQSQSILEDDLPSIINGKQVIKMNAKASEYSPNYIKIKAGVLTRWEITDLGTSGCTNAIIANGLFDGEIPLTHGKTSVKEFLPEKPGKYKFSCWMGMVSGTIEVI